MPCSRDLLLLMLLVVVFSITPQIVTACKAINWKPQPFLKRANKADIIAYGKVVNLTPIAEWPNAWPDAYDAEFEFYFVCREPITLDCPEVGQDQFGICVDECGENVGNAECPDSQMCCPNGCGHVCIQPVQRDRIGGTAIVRDMGELTSCSRTIVENGTNYIILLQWRDGELVPHEINTESAAFPDTDEIWNDLSTLCDVEAVAPFGRDDCPSDVDDKLQTVADEPCYSAIPAQTASAIIPVLTFFLSLKLIFY